jgi:hypothetical protein
MLGPIVGMRYRNAPVGWAESSKPNFPVGALLVDVEVSAQS